MKIVITISFLLISLKCAEPFAVIENKPTSIDSTPNTTVIIKEIEEQAKVLVKTFSKMAMQYFYRNSNFNMSSSCRRTFVQMFLDLVKLKPPVIKLLDAMPKPPYGMLKGVFTIMGDYDECLEVKVNKIGDFAMKDDEEIYHGQYCMVEVKLPSAIVNGYTDYRNGKANLSSFGKIGEFFHEFSIVNFETEYAAFKVGICLPSTCSGEDLQELLTSVPLSFLSMNVKHCEDGRFQQLHGGQIIFIIFLILLGTCVTVGTLMETNPCLKYLISDEHTNPLVQFLLAFSIYSNTKKLLKVNRSSAEDKIPAVNGMYVIGSLFVIIYHTYFMPFFTSYSSHAMYLAESMNNWKFTIMSTMGISIDAYFLFSGIFMVYPRSRREGKQMKVNIFQIIVRRYLRFFPAMLLVLGIIISMPLIGSGPVWSEIFGIAAENVRKWWWTYALMFNNFLTVKDQSFFPLWFIPCLMQITVIGVILSWFISKNMKFGIFLTLLTGVSCNIALGMLTYLRNYPLTYAIYYHHKREYFETTIYTSPLSHVSPYCIGLLLGYFMGKTPVLKLSRVYVILGWMTSVVLVLGSHFLCYMGHTGQDLDPIFTAVYAATHRTLYTIGMSWMVLACHYGYGGVLGEFMTWKGFQVLAKLSFSGYLLHYIVIAHHVSSIRAPLVFSHYETFIRYCSYATITILASYIFYVTFELPLYHLESILWPRRSQSNMDKNLNNQVNGQCCNGSPLKENGVTDPSVLKNQSSVLPMAEEKYLPSGEVYKL